MPAWLLDLQPETDKNIITSSALYLMSREAHNSNTNAVSCYPQEEGME